MNRRSVSIQPYEFNSDFSAATPNDADKIAMTSADLAALLAETRESTAALVRDETLAAETARLHEVSENLREALTAIVNLAAFLERAAIDEHDRQIALSGVRRLATTLIDGQGELFAKSPPRSPLGNHSGRG